MLSLQSMLWGPCLGTSAICAIAGAPVHSTSHVEKISGEKGENTEGDSKRFQETQTNSEISRTLSFLNQDDFTRTAVCTLGQDGHKVMKAKQLKKTMRTQRHSSKLQLRRTVSL